MNDLTERFREATWPHRIAMVICAAVLVGGAVCAIRVWVIPLCLRAYSFLVEAAIGYGFLTLMASIFSPATGKKMAELGVAVFERLLVDPLLMLFRAGKKKKKDVR